MRHVRLFLVCSGEKGVLEMKGKTFIPVVAIIAVAGPISRRMYHRDDDPGRIEGRAAR